METIANTHDNTADSLKFLSETAIAFTSDTISENIYEYICQCLKRLYPDAIILVNSLDHDNRLSKNEALDIGKWSLDQIISLIKFNPKGKAYKYDDSINELINGTITKFNGGLHELSFKAIPKKPARIAEKIFDIGSIYGIAFMVDKKMYALAIILLPKGQELKHAEILETFARQASITLKRLAAEKWEAKYRSLIEAIPDMMFRLNSSGEFLEYKANREELFYQADDIIGKTCQKLLPADVASLVEEKIHTTLQTGSMQVYEYQLDMPYKGLQDYETRMIPHGKDEVIAIVRNITRRKESEQRILESETNLKAIIENSLDSIWMINSDLKIEYVNQRFVDEFYKCFGVKLAKGVTIIDKMPPAMQALWRERYEKVFQNQNLFFEDKIEDEDNITFIEVAMQPVVMDGKVSGITFSGRDISLRRLAEESLKKSAAELRQLNGSKDRFFSIIAHDLRSPFNSILGLSNYLMEEASNLDVKEIEKSAAVIHESASQTMQLLENLLSWARMQQGRIPYTPKNLLLHELAASAISFISDQAEQKNIRLLNEVPEDLIARADADMLQTILRNLVSNAVKFTRPGGQVEVSAKTVENNIHFFVRDNGIGISAENIRLIFDVTTSYTKRGTANEKGTGLGLLVCKEFVEKHGGQIWAESEPGKGSVFGFALPADAAACDPK